MRRFLALPLVLWLTALTPVAAQADSLEVNVQGTGEAEGDNIRAFIGSAWVPAAALRTERRRQRFIRESTLRAEAALRPFGWYFPTLALDLRRGEGDAWIMDVQVDPGPALTIESVDLQLAGDGADFEEFLNWVEDWPMAEGQRLVQPTWDERKGAALDVAAEYGFLSAGFTTQRIELDLESNTARLVLHLDTGPRAAMGEVRFEQDQVLDIVLQPQPRFEPGVPYRAWYVDRLRTDLWKTGFFENVAVEEIPRPDASPPVVDFVVTADKRKPTTHQATLGYGTDSQVRFQYRWTWHRISDRGDSLAVATGYQQRDNEFLISGEYRLPRQNGKKQFWLANTTFKTERNRFELTDGPFEDPILAASGRVEDYVFRLGRGQFRDISFSRERMIESIFVEYLYEDGEYNLSLPDDIPVPLVTLQNIEDAYSSQQTNLTVGMDWSWPVIMGSGFHTYGHNERAWLMHSNDAWGSDLTFTQAYFGTRWNLLLGERWKMLLRGEAGYTNAPVQRFSFDIDGQPVNVSITELPYLYSFKAGGSRSVRGYEFERLSDSGLGANHLLTASIEGEYNFHGDWSAAAFFDIGNAFNSWSDPDLKRGVGVGIRWYTVAGPIRVALASALDLEGDPWTVHITIGTPLL